MSSLHPDSAPWRPYESQALAALADFGRFAAAKGWVPARAGNYSHRLNATTALVTRTGVDKGAIGPNDVAAIALDGAIPAGMSAETPLHLARYRADAGVMAVLHVHTVAATVLSRADLERDALRVEGFELQKAFHGITTHEGALDIPIFANDQDTVALAERVEARIGPHPAVPCYLLAGHGAYAWGRTIEETRRHLEGLEFLLACILEERRLHR